MRIWHGDNKAGRTRIHRLKEMLAYMASLLEFDVIIRRRKKKRSDSQNRYYWGVVLRYIRDYTGHDEDELHYIFRQMYLGDYDDKGLRFARSSTELSKSEFCEYVDRIIQWAAEHNVVIPPSDEK